MHNIQSTVGAAFTEFTVYKICTRTAYAEFEAYTASAACEA